MGARCTGSLSQVDSGSVRAVSVGVDRNGRRRRRRARGGGGVGGGWARNASPGCKECCPIGLQGSRVTYPNPRVSTWGPPLGLTRAKPPGLAPWRRYGLVEAPPV